MQPIPGPRFIAKLPQRLFAQLPQSRPGAICAVLVCGEICQVFTDQGIDGGVALSGMATNGSQHALIYAESDVLHKHSICATVLPVNDIRGGSFLSTTGSRPSHSFREDPRNAWRDLLSRNDLPGPQLECRPVSVRLRHPYTPHPPWRSWPTDHNGFGLSPTKAEEEVRLNEREFAFLPDNEQIHPVWHRLINDCSVHGRQVHAARLVAAMRVHGLSQLLTLNRADFVRYAGITVNSGSSFDEFGVSSDGRTKTEIDLDCRELTQALKTEDRGFPPECRTRMECEQFVSGLRLLAIVRSRNREIIQSPRKFRTARTVP
jgi:hypothetical protein